MEILFTISICLNILLFMLWSKERADRKSFYTKFKSLKDQLVEINKEFNKKGR